MGAADSPARPSARLRGLVRGPRNVWVLVLLGAHAGLLAFGAWRQSPTVDEPVHLAAGVWSWQSGRFDLDRGNPPLHGMVAACPVLWADPQTDWSRFPDSFAVGTDFLNANGIRCFWLITLGRWALIPFSLLGGYVCFRWASELYGYGAGLVALTLWCFDPNIIAHGQLITGDVVATAVGVTAFYAFWKWLCRPSLGRAALAGLALGMAELTKYVWVVLYPLWPALWILWRWQHRGQSPQRSWWREAGHGLLMVALSVWMINLGYAFDRPFRPQEHSRAGRTPGSALATVSFLVPLPEDYVGGIGEIGRRLASHPTSYLCGQWRRGGWWYYYFYAAWVKMPVGTLAILALAGIFSVGSRKYSAGKRTGLFLLVSLAALLFFITFCGSTQRLRYGLPMLPFALIWASKTGRAFAQRDAFWGVLVAGCLAWSVAGSLWIYPHSNSYFNELSGGPEHGHELLIESNVEWGQDLVYLKQWLDRHPEARPLHLAYFGRVDPRVIGIEFSLPPKGPGSRHRGPRIGPDQQGPLPGWHAVSVNLLQRHGWAVPDGKGGERWLNGSEFEYLFSFRPVATAGYSIHVYHIECAEANEVRRRLGMPPIPCDEAPAGR